eukprot:GEMP01000836.1.p1 GENE.GEMP01000836.1~~GEMP01000836.1.p1  ORF type:complete len:1563 (+),score=298.28 GEMP01000836.1:32-4690(+)
MDLQTMAKLCLSDGTTYEGVSFGADVSTSGEVVFNTGMVGYPESLTDPSYAGQILVLTFPLVGNYGVPNDEVDEFGLPKHFEGSKIHLKAVVVAEYSVQASHYQATKTLGRWLKEQGIPGITGVDTRAITKLIRTSGSMLGKVCINQDPDEVPQDNPNLRNLPAEVSRTTKQVYIPQGSISCHVLAVDCGIKYNIIRYFVNKLKAKLTVVPWDYDFTEDDFDGLFLSNGPGDPTMCQATIDHVKQIMDMRPTMPIFGICLGNQIMALAIGAKTYKMKFGNRGMNQPCIDLRTSRCYITPQNHGFAVETDSLPTNWLPLFVNANDSSNEGIIHRSRPWFSVQFHPEAAGGPTDTSFLFTYFINAISDPSALPVTIIPYSLPQTYKKVLVLGSGGLTIGQAGEFDYSGSQCIKALKEASIQSILVNPNIATVQTSAGMADQVYFLPITSYFVEEVIKKERPDGLFCTFGGQTALNCAVELYENGILEKYNIKVLGTPIKAIIETEDREIFARHVETCGYKVAESSCCRSMEEAVEAAKVIGYPILVRAAFALGGLGSGFCSDEDELRELVNVSLGKTSQIIIDKSLKGWKELEYEVVRDEMDNCITVCNMENFDPMGIHTGDSIVVAPSMTLTNQEYFALRACAITMIRHLGIVGECNIQFAVDPKSHEFRIIEVNARLSRSSALASKATGYPLAYVAAKLGLGHNLVQLRNSVTKCTTACFEPSLDYCVVKVPRWDLKKFLTVDQSVGSCMKSVGEVMAIGRTFEETLQKALRMVDDASHGFEASRYDLDYSSGGSTIEEVVEELRNPSPMRVWAIAKAFDFEMTIEEIHDLTKIDLWFLHKLYNIHLAKLMLNKMTFDGLTQDPEVLLRLKKLGFSDRRIAVELSKRRLSSVLTSGKATSKDVQQLRHSHNILPWVKQIDTVAGEFPAQTNYLYHSYHGCEHDVVPISGTAVVRELFHNQPKIFSSPKFQMASHLPMRPMEEFDLDPNEAGVWNWSPSLNALTTLNNPTSRTPMLNGRRAPSKHDCVIVLGCGCYRIGSSVEFDWCCVQAVRAVRVVGRPAIVINCNPETVSTDFDESDRLYFEELSHETVTDISNFEMPYGLIISVGGQTPNNLANGLVKEPNVTVLGTCVEAIDHAENRFKFSRLCDRLRIDQPEWSQFVSIDEALQFCQRVGFPVLVRPSYVLSGAAMRVIHNADEIGGFLQEAAIVSQDHPVVISKYIMHAKEVEFDAVGCVGEVVNYAISEHVENAGVHSGDASLLLPAQKLYVETHRRVKRISQKICKALQISGPFNIQFMCKDNEVKVIECNLRASRTFPFICKTFKLNLIDIATRVMLGQTVRPGSIHPMDITFVGCKAPVFSFSRLKNSDPRLGVEMQSTGEVACYGMNKYEAYLKALLASGFKLPTKNILISVGPQHDKLEFQECVDLLIEMGFQLYATKNTFDFIKAHTKAANCILVFKPHVQREPNITTMLNHDKIDLVINVPDSMDSQGLTDGFRIRRLAIDHNTSLLTDIKNAILFVQSLHRKWSREREGRDFWGITSWQQYHQNDEC